MTNKTFKRLLFIILCSLSLSIHLVHADNIDAIIEKATLLNQKAYQATTVYSQNMFWNEALTLLLNADKEMNSFFITDLEKIRLYTLLGDIFYNLNQLPWSLFYYEQSLILSPRSHEIKNKIQVINDQLFLDNDAHPKKLFNVYAFLSPKELIFLWCIFSLLLSLSLVLILINKSKNRKNLFNKITFFIYLFFWGFLSVNYLFTKFVSPLEGIVVYPTLLYRDSSDEAPSVLEKGKEKAIFPGSHLKILGLEEKGYWLKIETAEGRLGFVPNRVIRILEK